MALKKPKYIGRQRVAYPGLWRDLALIYAAVFLPMLLLAYVIEALK